jgi:hypothetical protein
MHSETVKYTPYLFTDKLVMEANRDAGREEAMTDADRASEVDVECTGRQAEVPLRGTDESMYLHSLHLIYYLRS